MLKRVTVGVAAATLLAAAALAQDPARTYKVKELKVIGEGRAVYVANCAACHGADAHGGWTGTHHSAAPDLTLIAMRDGRFETQHVALHIDGRKMSTQGEMPCWGRAFVREWPRTEVYAATRIYALTHYLDFVQEPQKAQP